MRIRALHRRTESTGSTKQTTPCTLDTAITRYGFPQIPSHSCFLQTRMPSLWFTYAGRNVLMVIYMQSKTLKESYIRLGCKSIAAVNICNPVCQQGILTRCAPARVPLPKLVSMHVGLYDSLLYRHWAAHSGILDLTGLPSESTSSLGSC